ncbi:MAG: 30S ribosomal protein S30e [Promethearchaeia archaeon]
MPGSHGSLTKAGKVRQQTPKVERTGVNATPKKPPRMRYRELYKKRFEEGKFGGQPDSINARRAKYR